jgi:hypothetical protein
VHACLCACVFILSWQNVISLAGSFSLADTCAQGAITMCKQQAGCFKQLSRRRDPQVHDDMFHKHTLYSTN